MTIGGREYSNILITDHDGGLLASITDEYVIAHNECEVNFTQGKGSEDLGWLHEYTRLVIETDEDCPVNIAEITPHDIDTSEGYRARMRPKYK